jgi:hypothetical protein
MKRRKSQSITLRGSAANGFMACAMIGQNGAKAHHGCSEGGPMEIAILAEMKRQGITPEPRPKPESPPIS